jgi:hypothetical protein
VPVNFRIGWTPGRLLQIASSRLAGQDWASSANSCGLLKLSKGVVVVVVGVVVVAASSGVACAVMWLSVSIVKVVIMVFLCSARCAVNPWITPQGWKGKAILNQIDDGEQTTMVGRTRCARLRVRANPSRTEAFRGLETDRDQERYLDTVEVWRSSRHGPTTVPRNFADLSPP